MQKLFALFGAMGVSAALFSQQDTGNAKAQYQTEQRSIGRSFSNYFYPNYPTLYSLPAKIFIEKMDSARAVFQELLKKYSTRLEKDFVADETTGIKYYFDKLIIDYPANHETYRMQRRCPNYEVIS